MISLNNSKPQSADIESPESIVVLTGAGISAESGIPTFRDENGMWENHRIEDVAYPEGFRRNPELVHKFYNERRHKLLSGDIQPNPAHKALARFEQDFSGEFLLVTQNVDNLHEVAGSQNILHMHGNLLSMRCVETGRAFEINEDIGTGTICECCDSAGNLRPDVVWFYEMPYFMDQISEALKHCDLFIAIGTSGNVYPAADFYMTAKAQNATTVEINLKSTNSNFDTYITDRASSAVPMFFNKLLLN
ncbi:MAG: NAD-dependent deacylase [Gammaproteobacteria bacterium]|nr:NAD-dependent deacylase [Gammaproteobacteria bacterium]